MIFHSDFWLVLSLLVLIIYLFFGGAIYINCINPIKGYIDIFRRKPGGKVIKRNLLFFITFPVMLATGTTLNTLLSETFSSTISVIITILTAMLFSFMAMINTKYENATQSCDIDYSTYQWLKIAHKETIDLITVEILVSIVILILCFSYSFSPQTDIKFWEYQNVFISVRSIISWFVFASFYFFIVNLLIVTKRFYNITQKQTH